jgi:hypothetical protein
MKPRFLFHPGILAALLLFLAGAIAARADDVTVTAAVADDETQVGQPVDFTITVNGAMDANVPENINVDGLTVTYQGPAAQTSISTVFGSGFHVQRSVVETYSVVANRAGNYVIPAQQIEVNGNNYTTQAVSLKVDDDNSAAGGGGASGNNDQSTPDDAGGKLFWAEFVLPKTTAYIGEAIPFEVRLFVDARVPTTLEEMPEITADGCTVEKTSKAEQSQVTRNGRDYVMVTFKSAVTPVKTGTLKLGPATVLAQAQIPLRRPHRPSGGPFDDPFFQNPFMDDAFRMMSPPQQVTIRGEPVEITAMPLPTAGMPASFAGAVGNYTMTTSVKPSMVEAGDPITVTATITGKGNFDKVTAPQVADPDGWRIYPPSGKFAQDDDIGISGSKTFEMAAIPQTQKTASPALEWSYFDPIKEQYVTLNEKGWPITIEGQFQTNSAPVMAATTQPQAAPTPDQSKPDIMYIRADSGGWGATFQPLYQNRIFWAAQGAPLLALLAFAGFQVVRKRAADQEARRVAGLRREKEIALAAMQRRDASESELYQAAARALRIEAAIQTGRAPDTLDGSEVSNARALDPAMAERVRRVFDRQAEAVYAGTSGGRSVASAETRVEALETVRGYENAQRAS